MADLISHEAPAHRITDLPLTLPTKLIGRDKTLAQVYTLLKQTKPVLVYGSSGIGKSAFAATLASAYTELPGGALWLTVNHSSLAEMIARIGRAYNVPELARTENPEERVGLAMTTITQNKPLVVIDGAIDINATSEFIMRCADRVPILIVTDSDTPISGPWTTVQLPALEPAAAQSLFSQIAPNSSQEGVSDLLSALGGSPLAVVVAAGVIKITNSTPRAFKEAMPPNPIIPGTLLALTAAFSKLGNAQQGLLLLLGATPRGGATGELISMVGNAPEAAIHQVMTPLVEAHLVERLSRYQLTYYRLHPLIHTFAMSWLRGKGRLDTLQTSMRGALVRYVEKHTTARAFDALAAEMDNILAIAENTSDSAARSATQQIVNALIQVGDFVNARGYIYEFSMLRRSSIGSASPFPAYTAAVQTPLPLPEPEIIPALSEDSDDADPDDEELIDDAVIAIDLEYIEEEDSEEEDSEAAAIRESVNDTLQAFGSFTTYDEVDDEDFVEDDEIDDESNDVELMPRTVSDLLDDNEDDDDFDDEDYTDSTLIALEDEMPLPTDAIDRLRVDLVKARQSANRAQQADILSNIAQEQTRRNLLNEALATHAEAATLYEDLNDNAGLLRTLELLISLASQTDNYEAAALYATRGSKLARELGNEGIERRMLVLLGDARLQMGEGDEAIRVFSDALDLARTANERQDEADILLKLGYARLDSGRADDAIDTFDEALTLFRAQNRRADEGKALSALGTASAEAERWTETLKFYTSALYIAREVHQRDEEMTQLNNLAFASAQNHELGQAVLRYRQALHLAYELDDDENIISITVELARLLVESPRHIDIARLVVDAAMTNNPTARDLRRLKDRIEDERPQIDPSVQVIEVKGSARDYTRNAYALLEQS